MKRKNKKQLTLGEMNPYIRRASKHTIEGGLNTGKRINVHYQLHYICEGVGTFEINHNKYRAAKGDFLLWGPGEVHSIEASVDESMEVIGVQFDMTRNYRFVNYPCIHYNLNTFSWDKVNEVIEFVELPELFPYTSVEDQAHIGYYLEAIVKQFESRSPFSQEIMSGLLKSVIILTMECNQHGNIDQGDGKKNVIDVIAYLKEHYNEKINNGDLGNIFNYHPNYLNQMILNYTGYTIQQYLIHMRMNKAIDLLEHTNMTICEVAEAVGGYSLHYFSRLFKMKVGLSPSEFRS